MACVKLRVTLKLSEDGMTLAAKGSVDNTKSANGIGPFPTRKLVRPEKLKATGANEVSNMSLSHIYRYKSDTSFRFMVVGRTDLRPTSVDPERWFGSNVQIRGAEQQCIATTDPLRCGKERRQSLAHLLNKERHNRVAKVVKEAIVKYVA